MAKGAAVLISLLVIGWVTLFASRGHFSGDHGVKFAQSVALWQSGFLSKALPHDSGIDPRAQWAPYPFHVETFRGQRQGIYSLVFTGLGAPAIAAFGVDGVVVLPLTGTILCLIGVLQLGRRLGLSAWVTSGTMAVTAGLTPLLFYAGQYQEHTLAAGLVTIGLVWLTPDAEGARRPAAAGVLVALAATLRPEVYCALPAAGLVVILQPGLRVRRLVRDGALLCGGALPVLLTYWGLNLFVSGTWDPLVLHNRDTGTIPNAARQLLFGPVESARLALTVSVAMCASLLPLHRLPPVACATARGVLGVALAGAGYWAFLNQHDRVLLGLFAATPLLGFPIFGGPWTRRTGALWAFAITFIAEVIAFDRSGVAGGIQVGARYFLPVIPALLVVGAAMIDGDLRSQSAVARVLALAVSIALIAMSIRPAVVGYRKAEAIARGAEEATARARAAPGDVVVTRRWWESQVLSPVLLDGKRLFYVDGDPTPLLARLRERDINRFAIAAYDNQQFALPGGGEARTIRRWPGWLEIQEMAIVPAGVKTVMARPR